jgi:alpha-L-rhamnosidase
VRMSCPLCSTGGPGHRGACVSAPGAVHDRMRFPARSLPAFAIWLIVGVPSHGGLAHAQQALPSDAAPGIAHSPPEGGRHRSTPSINPELLSTRWTAHWIRPAGAPPKAFGVYHFRKAFTLATVPERFVLHVSADNRYELYVNGRRLLAGPARGDLDHWRFETADIASALRPGRNVMAAVVWNFAEEAPMAQVTHETGLLVQGDTGAEAIANTDRTWKTFRSEAVSLLPIDRAAISYEYFVGGPGEQVDGAKYPWGWEAPDFDDAAWGGVNEITIGGPRGIRDTPSRWMLVPRGIPLMQEMPRRFARIARAEGAQPAAALLDGKATWTIAPRTTATLLLDAGHLTAAYPEVVTSGGRGASIALVYTEALRGKPIDGRKGEKGNRNEVEGKVVTGLRDRFLPDGGRSRLFRPLWWRTFRYVEIAVQSADEPLVVDDIRALFTAYPFEERGRFESSDPELSRIWEVGWRTARVCAHETYMDTPYWEQLQYIGDARIQALLSLYVGGDDRLVRNAIELFDESRIPDGLTQSRYPTMLPQIIPPFSLFWIGMMHDLYAWGGDPAFAKQYLHGANATLEWFAARLAPSGLLGRLEWWNFADWVEGSGFNDGEPPSDNGGESVILSLQFVLALREAADLEAVVGTPERAARYRALANRISADVRRAAWDQGRRFFGDTPAKRTFSQHANLLAVLADVVPRAEQAAFMRRVLEEGALTQATYYFQFYLFRAMKHAGLGDEYLAHLGPWREMLKLGLTTWAEKPEPTRSDSHAWSAHPNYDLLTTVAGVEPATPGFGTVRIEPHLGPLTSLKASIATPRGLITVSYTRSGESLTADVTLPVGVTGTFAWNGQETALRAGSRRVEF